MYKRKVGSLIPPRAERSEGLRESSPSASLLRFLFSFTSTAASESDVALVLRVQLRLGVDLDAEHRRRGHQGSSFGGDQQVLGHLAQAVLRVAVLALGGEVGAFQGVQVDGRLRS